MQQISSLYSGLLNVDPVGYCSSGAVEYALFYTLILGTICFILTKLTNDFSWVDRIWPILPIIYAYHFLLHQGICFDISPSTRQIVMAGLTTIWGLRLQYNFYRKGGFQKGGEDYRWIYIRKHFHWVLVQLLNFFFTAYYQLILILWFASPISQAHSGDFCILDFALTLVWLLLFVGEVTADQQQWDYQTEKYKLLDENKGNKSILPAKYKRGFIVEGLFKYSRHPNFFCQISIWWVQFLFSVSSVGLNWTGLGAVLLNLLFLGSTGLTEKISAQKYPQYVNYQKTTSKLIPLPPTESLKTE